VFALDTNILVYAHNLKSSFYPKAMEFVEQVLAEEDVEGKSVVGIPLQVCSEFINVITRQSVEKPLSLLDAIKVIRRYTVSLEISVIKPQPTQLSTFLELLETITSRKKVFDVALAATLKDNGIEGLYTVNVDDFRDFQFLKIVNPLV